MFAESKTAPLFDVSWTNPSVPAVSVDPLLAWLTSPLALKRMFPAADGPLTCSAVPAPVKVRLRILPPVLEFMLTLPPTALSLTNTFPFECNVMSLAFVDVTLTPDVPVAERAAVLSVPVLTDPLALNAIAVAADNVAPSVMLCAEVKLMIGEAMKLPIEASSIVASALIDTDAPVTFALNVTAPLPTVDDEFPAISETPLVADIVAPAFS